MKVVFWAKMSLARDAIPAALSAIEGTELVVATDLAGVMAALDDAEALILPDAPPDVARQVVDRIEAPGSKVRWMHFLTEGREGFEATGLPSGVAVTTPGGAVAPAVGEHCLALLLALARNLPRIVALQGARHWSRSEASVGARSLEDMTLAIYGYGQIGGEVARRARAFGMRVVGVSRSGTADAVADAVVPLDQADEVLRTADVLVLTVPLTDATWHLVDRAFLKRLKPGALLVNMARGGIVDQAALAEALAEGHLGGAAVDATDPEPLPDDHPLWDAPNLIISPHFAAAGSPASARRLARGAAENLRRLAAGEALAHRIA